MPRAQATQDTRSLVAFRFTGALACWGLAILAFWVAGGPLLTEVDQVVPWAVERLPPLLRITGLWFLFQGAVVILSAVGPFLHLTRGPRRSAVPPVGGTHPQDSAGRRGALGHRALPMPRIRLTERSAACVLVGLLTVFTLAYSWMAFTRHLRFNSTGYDLAIATQAIWNTAHGHPFATSLEVDNFLADHFAPSLLLLLPMYMVFPSPLTLIGIQALVVGLGVIPLYRLTKRRLGSVTLALVAAAVYALYPATGYLLRFDFHLESLAVLAFLAAFDAMDEGRWKLATVWLVIASGCKEDMGLTVAAFGLYVLFVRRKASWGTVWLLVGVAAFVFASFWLIPMLRGESSDSLDRYAWLGDSPGEMVMAVVTNPGKIWDHVAHPRQLLYTVQLLLPVGYLALLAPLALLLAGPALVLNLLSDSLAQVTLYYQYTAAIIPAVHVAAVLGVAHLRRMLGSRWGWRAVTLALLPLSLVVFLISNPFRESTVWAKLDNAEAVKLALQTVPPQVSVATTNGYAPHLAHRRELYIIGFPSQRMPPTDPDVVFFNLRDNRFTSSDEYREYLLSLDTERYGVTFNAEGVVVIEKDKGSHKDLLGLRDPAALRLLMAKDLIQMFALGQAQVSDSSAPEPIQVRRYTMPKDGDSSDVLFVHSGASISFRTVLPKEPTWLYFRAAMDPESWDWGGDGATFVVQIVTDAAEPRDLYRKHISNDASDRRWHDELISLAEYAGEKVTLTLKTEPGPAGDYTGDWAGWGMPILILDSE